MHFDGIDWLPYTYQWNENQTDAILVGAAGAQQEFEIEDSESKRTQTWHFAARAECQRCHNKYSGTVLGFNIPQLHQAGPDSQLDQLASLGLLTSKVPNEQRQSLANPTDHSASLDARARAYLHVNCSHCHRMSAGGAVLSYMHFDLPLDKTNMLAAPSQGNFKIDNAMVIAPGEPLRSVLLYRMSKAGGGRMPRLGTSEMDSHGVALIAEWIASLHADSTNKIVPSPSAIETEIARLKTDYKFESHESSIQQLLSSTSGALALQRALKLKKLTQLASRIAIQSGAKHEEEVVRDLFEQFLPANERTKRLGDRVQPESILQMVGDAQRGGKLFFEGTSVNCQNCHRVTGVGKEIGPDLSLIGDKLNASQTLESILEPSKMIDPKYRTHLIETKDGQVLSGIVVQQNDRQVVVRNAKGEEVSLPAVEIEQIKPQSTSLMPDQLVRDLTAQQLADLLAFLCTLKKP